MAVERTEAGAALRAQAARLSAAVIRDRIKLETVLRSQAKIEARDRPLLSAMLFGVFRWHHRLQWQLDRLLNRPITDKEAELSALLRLGLYQLQWLRVPDHAAVSATVAAARLLGFAHARGLVNAVLRRFLREREALSAAMRGVDIATFSHPAWMIAAIAADWKSAWQGILSANNEEPPMWLRVNTARTTLAGYEACLRDAGVVATRSAIAVEGLLLDEPLPTSRLPGFAEGLVSVQDGAAQLAAHFLDPRPGSRVLDACAAPGGKTAHILELQPDLADMWALDRDAERLETVGDNLRRLGLGARLLHADATDPDEWWDGRPFDRVLVDAPCSALGVIRRHPDIKVLRREADLTNLIAVQQRLLSKLWPLLAHGGRMLYSTCTVLRRENLDLVGDFVRQRPDAQIVGPGPDGLLQRLPGEANMDGFFFACIRKQQLE